MEKIRKLVDDGVILNFDACTMSTDVHKLFPGYKENEIAAVCAPFYKTGHWRGGISPAIDDRKETALGWTSERTKQYKAIRDDITKNFNNAVSVITNRTSAAALDYPGAAKEIDAAKQTLASSLSRMAMEGNQISTELTALQKAQNGVLADRAREKEAAIRKMEQENLDYKFRNEASEERVKDLYNRYEGNQTNMLYSYAPWEVSQSSWYSWPSNNQYINLNPMSRSGLLFLAFFFGFVAIIAIGVKVFMLYSSVKAAGSPLFGILSNPIFRSITPNPGRIVPETLKY
jgi:hypothetical protein